MSLFFNKKEERAIGFQDVFGSLYPEETGAMRESAYLSCLEYISKSIAKLPLEILNVKENGSKLPDLKNKNYYTLTNRFNSSMNSYVGMKTFIENGLHNGISGLYIDSITKELYPVLIHSLIVDDVGLINSDKGNPILYSCQLDNFTFDALDRDLIVFKFGSHKYGLNVVPVKTLVKETVTSLKQGQTYLNNIFKNGGMGKIAVQMTSSIEEKKELAKIQEKYNKLYSNSESRVFTIPAGYQLQSLTNSLSENDFMNIRKLSRKEICATFGLPSTIIGDYDGVNYNSMEQLQLQIYSDCLQPIMTQLEQEFTHKYLSKYDRGNKVIEFDEDKFFKMDYNTRIDTLTKLKDKSSLTANEVRRELGYPDLESEYANEVVLTSGYLPESLAKTYYINKVGATEGGGEDANKED